MTRTLGPLALVVLAVAPALAADPVFIFVESPDTKKHIAVQPKEEHDRIYFGLRVENMKGKTMFVRTRCLAAGEDGEVLQGVKFNGVTDNDLWHIYLRTPRYEDKTATYQIEVGDRDERELNMDKVRLSYAWKVTRAQGKADVFAVEEDAPGGGKQQVNIPLLVRHARVEGGKVSIVLETQVLANPKDLKFGIDNTNALKAKVTGDGIIRVVR